MDPIFHIPLHLERIQEPRSETGEAFGIKARATDGAGPIHLLPSDGNRRATARDRPMAPNITYTPEALPNRLRRLLRRWR